MSHGITKFDEIEEVDVHWHKKNKVKEILQFENGPLDWEIRQKQVFDDDMNPIVSLVEEKPNQFKEKPYKRLVSDFKEGDGSVTPITLHVAQQSYEIIQNRQLYEAIQVLLDEYGFRIVSMGSVMGRKRVFFTLESDESTFNVGDDENILRISVISSHNGSAKAGFIETAFRVVCNNTFQAAYNQLESYREASEQGGDVSKFFDFVKHTKNADIKLQKVKQGMLGYVQRKEILKDELVGLTKKSVSVDDAGFFTLGIVAQGDALSKRAFNQSDEILSLFQRGTGNNGKNRYDLLNGFTEFYTHKAKEDPDSMFVSSEFGTYANKKQDAFISLTDESAFEQTCERGKALVEAL